MEGRIFNIYIAFDYEQISTKIQTIDEILSAIKTQVSIVGTSEKPDRSQEEWEVLLESKIESADFLIVLVGPNIVNAKIEEEMVIAQYSYKPYFGIYVDGADQNTPLPKYLQHNRVVDFDEENIKLAFESIRNNL